MQIPDPDNPEFNAALDLVQHTRQNLYLTGKAGSGKTTFLKYLREHTDRNVVVLAPTGVAAINAGGQTINSFFNIPLRPFLPDDPKLSTKDIPGNIFQTFQFNRRKINTLRALDLLIIDEISMVRVDMIEVINRLLQVFRRKYDLPFGGVQVIFIGDLFQLPPIEGQDWNVLSPFYASPFFFSASVFQSLALNYIELKKIYRQNEQEFIDLLNRVRVNNLLNSDFSKLNSRLIKDLNLLPKDSVTLCTHNDSANRINAEKLAELATPIFTFNALVSGNFSPNSFPADKELHLKVGAQIMFVKNDSNSPRKYFNGKIGRIFSLEEGAIVAEFEDETRVTVERERWQNIRYSYNSTTHRIEEEILGEFIQFPIKLAWAITVNKSQGLTFEKVILDVAGAFAAGQVYVALSRCISFNGIFLRHPIPPHAIFADPRVIAFSENETPDTLITQRVNEGKADALYAAALQSWQQKEPQLALAHFLKAMRFRNDMETPNFLRALEIYSNRFKIAQKAFSNSQSELAKTKVDLAALNNELTDSLLENDILIQNQEKKNKEISALKDELQQKSQTETWQKIQIREISHLHSELTEAYSSQSDKISDLQNQVRELNEKLDQSNRKLRSIRDLTFLERVFFWRKRI